MQDDVATPVVAGHLDHVFTVETLEKPGYLATRRRRRPGGTYGFCEFQNRT
jgi:hypothetical protein